MTTIAKRVKTRKSLKGNNTGNKPAIATTELHTGEHNEIEVSRIEFSPKNYRKIFNPADIEELAESIKQHGLLHALTIRPVDDGRYELIIGECRLRACHLAGIEKIPVVVRELTDEQANEIRLAENLKRVNPHPLEESHLIAAMQAEGKTTEEIALRIGKSKAFVYARVKLSGLIKEMQEIFIVNKLTIQEAFNIAALSEQSQQEFFKDYCSGWKKKDFKISNLHNALSRYRYDLKNAPFDIKDKNLKPAMGACTNCPFNSATLKSLFPEFAKEAVCTNKACYKDKCMEHTAMSIRKLVTAEQPDALLLHSSLPEETEVVLQSLPETDSLPRIARYEVTVFNMPSPPDRDDHMDTWNTPEGEEPEFDEDGYNEAMQDYEHDLAAYQVLVEKETTKKGLTLSNGTWKIVLFSTEEQAKSSPQTSVTAKEVQQAIKEGKATPELLTDEIARITSREARFKELDKEKIQLQVHEQFLSQHAGEEPMQQPTAADHVCARLVIYQSLDYSVRNAVNRILFSDNDISDHQQFYDILANLPEGQYAFLIRMAVAGKSDSKFPNNITSFSLVQLAKASGLDVDAIEEAQQDKATARQEKMELRIKELEKKIEKMKVTA
jgi:ParB family chromosome partitioning protein